MTVIIAKEHLLESADGPTIDAKKTIITFGEMIKSGMITIKTVHPTILEFANNKTTKHFISLHGKQNQIKIYLLATSANLLYNLTRASNGNSKLKDSHNHF